MSGYLKSFGIFEAIQWFSEEFYCNDIWEAWKTYLFNVLWPRNKVFLVMKFDFYCCYNLYVEMDGYLVSLNIIRAVQWNIEALQCSIVWGPRKNTFFFKHFGPRQYLFCQQKLSLFLLSNVANPNRRWLGAKL